MDTKKLSSADNCLSPPYVGLQCEAYRWIGELDDTMQAIWKQLLAMQYQAPIFSYPEWYQAAYTAGLFTPWRMLVIRRGREPIGLLPLCQPHSWLVEAVAPLAEDYQPLLIDPDAEDDVWTALAGWLRTNKPNSLLSLGLCGDQQRLTRFQHACAASALHSSVVPAAPTVWIDLHDNWEQYLAALGSATRTTLRRKMAHLKRDYPETSVEITTDSATADVLIQEFFRLYRLRWGDQVGGSTFDDPRKMAFYREIMTWAVRKGYGAIGVLRLRERVVALQTLLHIPGQHTAYCHFNARDSEGLPSRASPGMVLVAHVMRWANARGVTMIGIGTGNASYKLSLGGSEQPLWEMRATCSPLASALLPPLTRAVHVAVRLPVHVQYHAQRLLRGR